MALPSVGAISTDDIMGPNGLNIGVQTKEFGSLWSLARAGTIPKNKAIAGGPYVLPNDWYGYVHGTTTFFLPLAYNGNNHMVGTNATFATARTVGTAIGATEIEVAAVKSGSNYSIERGFIGFDTTAVTTASSGGIQLTSYENAVSPGSTHSYVVVKTNSAFPANHPWVLADFNQSNGATLVSNVVTISNPSGNKFLDFQFNAAGLSYINANASSTFVIVQYNNDYLNVVTPNASVIYFLSTNTTIKLYYNQ